MELYNPREVTMVVGGILIEGPFATDTMVQIGSLGKRNVLRKGILGKHTRVHTGDSSGFVRFILKQQSPSNQKLLALMLADEVSKVGVPYPVVVRDANGTSLHTLPTCFFDNVPDNSFGKLASDRVWALTCNALIPS